MSSADPFLPAQGVAVDIDEEADESPTPGLDADPPTTDLADDEERAEEPDPAGDDVDDEGLPPTTSGPFHAFSGEKVDPAADA